MAYTALTAAQTDANSPLDQTLMDAIRTNSADHESRIQTLESPSVRCFSHFDERTHNTGILLSGVTLAQLYNYLNKFHLSISGTAAGTPQILERVTSAGADDHTLRFNSAVAGGTDNHDFYLNSRPLIYWNNRVKPVVYEARIKMSDVINSLSSAFAGFLPYSVTVWDSTPNDGIYLESTGTVLRFTAANGGSFTNGSSLTPPSDAAWFKVKIIWEDDPSTRARCFIDYEGGSGYELQETLAADLPAAKDLHACLRYRNFTENAQTFDTDFIDSYTSGPISEV